MCGMIARSPHQLLASFLRTGAVATLELLSAATVAPFVSTNITSIAYQGEDISIVGPARTNDCRFALNPNIERNVQYKACSRSI
jgi:hypothetical protein